MKLTFQIIAFIAIFSIIYLSIMNGHETFDLQLLAPSYNAVAQTTVHTTKTLNMAFILLMTKKSF